VLGYASAVLAAYVKGVPTTSVLGAWDGRWYLRAALEGYPSVIGPGDFYRGDVTQVQSTIPFFPLYPALSRGVMEVFGVGVLGAETAVALVAGALATCLVWALARDVYDRQVADRAAVLFAFAPGAIVLSMLYAEGLAIALLAASLLLMRRSWWVAGGVCAALATATRPNALIIIGVCVWMAGVAVYRRREWRALAAPVLAPLGVLAYFGYLWRHTGEVNAWFDVQRRGWGEKTDLGIKSAQLAWAWVKHPATDPYLVLYGLTLLVGLALLVPFLRRPFPPFELVLFTLASLALSMSSATLNLRPRFLFFAFPLVIVLARWVRGRAYGIVVGASAASMGLLGVFYFLEKAYYP
jgi:4-amino-4-deoxy-L-arabinose transferase-like glycosyltransferase